MTESREKHAGDREQEKKKLTVPELIDQTAKASAREVLHLQHKVFTINYYRATEDALRAYVKVKRQLENPEEYGFFPTGKSHDISVAPPPGLGLRDKVEVNELFVESRKNSFIRTADKFNEIHMAVKAFENRREFIVIRMYYFGEDENGNYRGDDAKRYTWEEIAEALERIGINRSVSVLRGWRSSLVREMAVMMHGLDGAVSINTRENTQQMKHERNGEKHDTEENEEQQQVLLEGAQPGHVLEAGGDQ